MACDIHIYAERKADDGTYYQIPLAEPMWRSYSIFAWLAGVRNYSSVKPLAEPRGLPVDVSSEVKAEYQHWQSDGHTPSWLTVEEMINANFDGIVEDRRVTIRGNGACTCEAGYGVKLPLRVFLGKSFMDWLRYLQATGADRIVFWFDS